MANVLIGILAVLLFVALALAGALFLGPEFMRSINNSRANALVQRATQIANAVNLKHTREVAIVPVGPPPSVEGGLWPGIVALRTEGWIKSIPDALLFGEGEYRLADATGRSTNAAAEAAYVMLDVGERDRALCEAVERQVSGPEAPIPEIIPSERISGCVSDTFNAGALIVYVKI